MNWFIIIHSYVVFSPVLYSCVKHDSKKTVPIRSVHSTTIIHTVQQENMNEPQNNELVKSTEARSPFF